MQYVLQILAQLLESSPPDALSANFGTLLDPLLTPVMWETRGNVPALTRLLAALIPRAAKEIASSGKLQEVLGIFQSLVGSKKMDMYAFDILDSCIKSFEPAVMDQYFAQILDLVLKKIQANAADSFKLRFVRFYHLVSARLEAGYGSDYFIKHCSKLQPDLFRQIYPAIILPETDKIASPVDRKLAVVSYAKTLCDSTAFATEFQKGWANTCIRMLVLLANPPAVTRGFGDEIITEADVDGIGFGIHFTALNTCKPLSRDDYPEIANVKEWVGQYMKAADTRHNGAISQFIVSRLGAEHQAALVQLFQ
jgi:exportin-2 (importin alpha re-exporter)